MTLTSDARDRLAQVEAFCSIKNPYEAHAVSQSLFDQAIADVTAWHRAGCDYYARLCASEPPRAGLPPALIANFFKSHKILSIKDDDVALHLTSSGTSGQKSQIFFDARTIDCAQRMVDSIFAHYGWVTPDQPANYLLYSYEPRPDFKVGTSYTDNFLMKYAPANRVAYALKNTGDGRHEFDPFGVIRALQSFAEEGLPLRILGFPAFMHFTLARMRTMGIAPLKFPANSLTFFGGGWKGQADEEIPKASLYAEIEAMLGIPNSRIRDGYGSVEHCVPYVECTAHEFHVPTWSRVAIRDVRTLAPLPFGQVGYLTFLSPYITSVPAHHVMMQDLAELHPPEACTCGLATPFFRIKGRAGLSRNKSCAVAAAELLKGGS